MSKQVPDTPHFFRAGPHPESRQQQLRCYTGGDEGRALIAFSRDMGEVENIILEIFYLPSSCLMRPKGFIYTVTELAHANARISAAHSGDEGRALAHRTKV